MYNFHDCSASERSTHHSEVTCVYDYDYLLNLIRKIRQEAYDGWDILISGDDRFTCKVLEAQKTLDHSDNFLMNVPPHSSGYQPWTEQLGALALLSYHTPFTKLVINTHVRVTSVVTFTTPQNTVIIRSNQMTSTLKINKWSRFTNEISIHSS